jgi:hypothetical protein
MLHFITTNFGAIVSLFGMIAGLIVACPHLTSLRVRQVAQGAVLFAQQYEAKQAALGQDKPAFSVLKSMAMDYAQKRLPNVDVTLIDQEIESALALLKLKYPKIGTVEAVMGYCDPTLSPPAVNITTPTPTTDAPYVTTTITTSPNTGT